MLAREKGVSESHRSGTFCFKIRSRQSFFFFKEGGETKEMT